MTVNRPPSPACALTLALLFSACSHTSYVDQDNGHFDSAALNPFGRVVEYRTDLGLTVTRPACILAGSVEPAKEGVTDQHQIDVVHAAVLGRAKATITSITVIDGGTDRGQAMMEAAILGCPYVVLTDLTAQADTNLLVWSRKRIGIRIRMVRTSDGEELWCASHVASRSEGDIPLDPVTAVISLFRSTDFNSDADIAPSLIADAIRRIFETFPLPR